MKTNNPNDLWVLLCPPHRKRIPYNEMIKRNAIHASAPICSRDNVEARITAVRKELATFEVQESKLHYYYHNVFSGEDVEVSELEINECIAHGINVFTK